MKYSRLFVGALWASTFLAGSALAQPKTTLDAVIVTAEAGDETSTLTVPGNAEALESIQRTPGGVALVPSEDFENRFTESYEDALRLTPGVIAQKRFGEEVRLSIRGSGLSRGFHLRGLTMLQDGIPFNLADGSGDFQELDALALQRIEVYKGANALQFGSTTLGGAINSVSKTGKSNPGNQVRLEIGSDQTYRTNVQAGRDYGTHDVFLSVSGISSGGFRDGDDQESVKFNGNIGRKLSDTAETRFYLSANVIDQDLPGSVSLQSALNDPTAANPAALSQAWARDIRSVRLSNKTTFEIGNGDQLDVGGFMNIKDLFHPITSFVGVIDQEGIDYGAFVQSSGDYDLSGHRNEYRLGIRTHFNQVDARVFQNIGGTRGNLTSNADQSSTNLILYGENDFYIRPDLALVTGAQLAYVNLDVDDSINSSESDDETYTSFNPKLGLVYEPYDAVQFFGNISRSFENPTLSEVTQSGTVGFTPIDEQEAWTLELGTRGQYDRYSWDLSLYRAWIDGELLQFTTGPGIPATTFNADDTIHQGVELGFDVRVADSLFDAGDSVTWRNAYTFSDFYFDGDAQYGDNDIAGVPKHFYQTEVRYDNANGWYGALQWELASEARVDFANTLDAPGYGIISADGGYDINESVTVFAEGRNLLDHEFVSTFSTIVNSTGNTDVFYPGEGRRMFAGVRVKF